MVRNCKKKERDFRAKIKEVLYLLILWYNQSVDVFEISVGVPA